MRPLSLNVMIVAKKYQVSGVLLVALSAALIVRIILKDGDSYGSVYEKKRFDVVRVGVS